MKANIIGSLLIVFGLILFAVGMTMFTRDQVIQEKTMELKKGDKTITSFAGAGVGSVTGATTGLTVAAIGTAITGTGFGIPVGLAILGIGVTCGLLGGGVGGATGYWLGSPDTYVPIEVTKVLPAYSPFEIWGVLVIGSIIVAVGVFVIFKGEKLYLKATVPQKLILHNGNEINEEN